MISCLKKCQFVGAACAFFCYAGLVAHDLPKHKPSKAYKMKSDRFNQKEVKAVLAKIAQRIIDSGVQSYSLEKFVCHQPKDEFALLSACKQFKKWYHLLGNDEIEAIKNIKHLIKTYLRSFIAEGFSLCFDGNLGLVWDTMNPSVTINFVNPDGEVKTRKHQFIINSIGFKFVMSVDICGIWLTGKGFNYYDSNKELSLGSGIDLGLACSFQPIAINFLYSSIKDMPGSGVVLLGYPIGISGALSYVYGGKIIPLN